MSPARKPAVRKKLSRGGRPQKFEGGTMAMTAYFSPKMLDSLRRFTAYQTALDGKRRSPSDVLADALSAYPAFQDFQKQKKG